MTSRDIAPCGALLCMHKAECPTCGKPNPRYIGTKESRAKGRNAD